MAKGRAVAIVLEAEEKSELMALTRKHGAPQALAERARIVLAAGAGLNNKEIAAKVGVCAATAGTWRNRFAESRMDGLYDEPRPGAPREIGDDEIAATIRKTLETRPKGATHWSLRTMTKEIGHAPSTVHRIWQAFGLRPHRVETFKLSSDPLFVEKVRDIVGLYLSPPERAIVLCVDEKSQVQALDRTQPLLPMRPGQVERHTHDYKRHGTTSLFAALDVKAGTVVGKCMSRHRATEFRKFLDEVERNVPTDLDIRIIMTTTVRTKPSSFATGSPSARAGTCTSPQHPPRGSTKSNDSSRCSPNAPSGEGRSARLPISKTPSKLTSRAPMVTRSPSAGPRPLTTSWPASNASASALWRQTRSMKRT
jgi:transposase